MQNFIMGQVVSRAELHYYYETQLRRTLQCSALCSALCGRAY